MGGSLEAHRVPTRRLAGLFKAMSSSDEPLQIGEPTYWHLVEGEARTDLPLIVFDDDKTWTVLRFAECGAEIRMQGGDHPVLGRIVGHSLDLNTLTVEVALVSKCGSQWFLTIPIRSTAPPIAPTRRQPPRPNRS